MYWNKTFFVYFFCVCCVSLCAMDFILFCMSVHAFSCEINKGTSFDEYCLKDTMMCEPL